MKSLKGKLDNAVNAHTLWYTLACSLDESPLAGSLVNRLWRSLWEPLWESMQTRALRAGLWKTPMKSLKNDFHFATNTSVNDKIWNKLSSLNKGSVLDQTWDFLRRSFWQSMRATFWGTLYERDTLRVFRIYVVGKP